MSRPHPPNPAKLAISLFMKDKALLGPVATRLVEIFGPVDLISGWFAFNFTSYYEPEMGRPLYRRMLGFKTLVSQDALAAVKHQTNGIEGLYSSDNHRRINIDPGYVLLERFVLATGKNFAHRIYIGQNIYADLTLTYSKGSFQTLPWTYPDYASPEIRQFLLQVRHKYSMDLKVQMSEVRSQKSE
jgi:hypothetical protein